MAKIKVLESNITILKDDYISLTDMVRNIENGLVLIEKWLRNKNTIEFLGIWEEMYNADFNSPEFEGIKNEAGYIASHEANYDFIVYDNLSNSSKNSLKTAGEIDG